LGYSIETQLTLVFTAIAVSSIMSSTIPTTTTTPPPSAASSSTTSTCTTAVPQKYGYVPPDACNSNYNFYPNFDAAVALTALFGVLLVGHVTQAFIYRKRYCWVLIAMVLWETTSFALRAVGAHQQQNLGFVIAFTLLFLLAPLCKLS
jgi:hypothetical protein